MIFRKRRKERENLIQWIDDYEKRNIGCKFFCKITTRSWARKETTVKFLPTKPSSVCLPRKCRIETNKKDREYTSKIFGRETMSRAQNELQRHRKYAYLSNWNIWKAGRTGQVQYFLSLLPQFSRKSNGKAINRNKLKKI